MNKVLLIDGHSILSRAYYGIPLLSASSGVHTNAVYGFINIMLKCIDDERADFLAVAFDLERQKLRRTKLYPEYKGTRKPMPEELLEQVPLTMKLVRAMNIPILTLEGYEADDLLGTAAKRCQNAGYEVSIVSGDRDLLQLCDGHIRISMPKTSKGKTEVYNYYPQDVIDEYQVTPAEFIDVKALMGDSSDNIPGLPGVGPKTATEIIVKFGSIENAYAHADEVRPPRAQKALKEHFDLAVLSKELATIDIDAPIDMDPAVFFKEQGHADGIYTPAALGLLRELELKNAAARFSRRMEKAGTPSPQAGQPEAFASPDASAGASADASAGASAGFASGALRMDRVKTVADPFLAGVALKDAADDELTGFCVYTGNLLGQETAAAGLAMDDGRCFVLLSSEEYPAAQLLDGLRSLVAGRIAKGRPLATLELKRQLKILDIPANPYIDDLSIAQYVADPLKNSYNYEDLAAGSLGLALESGAELLGRRKVCEAVSDSSARDAAIKYIAYNAMIPYFARRPLLKRLESDGTLELYREIEIPLVYCLDDMEKAGIRVDGESLAGYAASLRTQIDALTAEIYAMAGEPFNINSPKQLGTILFEKLGISGGKKTKTGYSTAADVLEKIAGEHEIVGRILRYRTITKLYSTYAAGLSEYIAEDGRIHGTFNQTITATGRISSTDPNLQNIPVRTEEGKEIRKVFIPDPGYVFVDADYSQVELRILAALSGDPVLIEAYKNAADIHTLTASQVFRVPVEEVTPEMRRNAKAVNFGIVYGISAFGLGEGLSISRGEAAQYIEKYFETYPGVKKYLDMQVADAKKNGYVRTWFGRIRPVPEIRSSNFMQRSFGERIAMNSPIQGTAADIMKIAMIRTAEALRGMKSRIVLQVHDELLIETAPEEAEKVRDLVKDCMENAAQLPVRLSAEVKTGYSWFDCH